MWRETSPGAGFLQAAIKSGTGTLDISRQGGGGDACSCPLFRVAAVPVGLPSLSSVSICNIPQTSDHAIQAPV